MAVNLEAVKIVMACVAGPYSQENSEFMKTMNYLSPEFSLPLPEIIFFFIVIMTRFKYYT